MEGRSIQDRQPTGWTVFAGAIWYVLSTLSLIASTAVLVGLTARLFSSEKIIIGR